MSAIPARLKVSSHVPRRGLSGPYRKQPFAAHRLFGFHVRLHERHMRERLLHPWRDAATGADLPVDVQEADIAFSRSVE